MTTENLIINISRKDFFTRKSNFFNKNLNKIIIVKNAIKKSKIRKIAKRIMKTKKHYVKRPIIVEGVKNICTDGNFIKKKEKQYTVINKSWYFFPWNQDNTGLVKETSVIRKRLIELNDHNTEVIEKNTPRNGTVSRMNLIYYPYETGLISTHKDPMNLNKLVGLIYISAYKTDYDKGGFYIISNKKKYVVDHHVESGDLLIFSPYIAHGVDPVSKLDINSNKTFDGRCVLQWSLVQSREAKKRIHTEGVVY